MRAAFAATAALTLTVSGCGGPIDGARSVPVGMGVSPQAGPVPSALSVVIHGSVSERGTGQPLPGVSVNYLPSPHSGNAGTVVATTDASGAFSVTSSQVNNQPNGTVSFTLMGYYAGAIDYSATTSAQPVNVSLMHGGTILRGKMFDATLQAPISGGNVVLSMGCGSGTGAVCVSPNVQYVQGISDSNGLYSIDASQLLDPALAGPLFGASIVFLGAQGFVPDNGFFSHYGGQRFAISGPYPATQDLAMVPEGIVLLGTVTDRITGTPLAGVSVNYLLNPYSGSGGSVAAITDANGIYAVTGSRLNNQVSGTLSFTLPGHYAGTLQYAITSIPTLSNITLLQGGTILQGTVTDSITSAGIAGANLVLTITCSAGAGSACISPNDNYVRVTTGSSGAYSADASKFLDPAVAGALTTANVAFLGATGYFAINSGPSFSISGPYPVTQGLSLYPDAGPAIQGTVTDRTSGLPLAGVSVYYLTNPYSGGAGPIVSATDVNGKYSISGSQINGQTSGTISFILPGYYASAVAYSLVSIPTTADVSMVYGGTIIQGQVTDATTNAGISGANIVLTISCGTGAGSACISPNDNYVRVTSVAGGVYSVDASALLDPAAAGSLTNATLAFLGATGYFANNGGTSFSVVDPYPVIQNFTLLSDTGSVIQGTVTDRATGLPLVGVSVDYLLNPYSGGAGPVVAVTDSSGHYSLTGPQINDQTSGTVSFTLAGYYAGANTYSLVTVPTTLNITLVHGGTILGGMVTDAKTTLGISGANLVLTIACANGTGAACISPNGNYVRFTTVAGGGYSADASQFLDPAIAGPLTTATVAFLGAAGYFSDNGGASFPIAGPYPLFENFTLVPY
jgi:hypothetical protein